MRILHVLDHSLPLHSGYSFRTLSILKQQRERGWHTIHLTGPKQGRGEGEQRRVGGWHFFRTDPATGFLPSLPVIRHLCLIERLARRIALVAKLTRPDILHAHSPALNAIATLRAARRLGLPVVYEIRAFWEDAAVDHGTSAEGSLRYRLSRTLETYAAQQADAVTTICAGLRDDLRARGIADHKITVVPNAVNIEQFDQGCTPDRELARQLGLGSGPVFGFVGSFYGYEGLDMLLDVLPRLLPVFPGLQLLLVGGGPETSALKRQAQRLGIQNSVCCTGRVPHDDVARYYRLLDVLVYPRRPMRLTHLVTPLKPLEAMAQGLLVLASDVGGHRELIEDGRTGVLFEAGNVDALAEALGALLAQPQRWPALRRAARRFVESERSWDASVARYAPVYERLAGSGGTQ